MDEITQVIYDFLVEKGYIDRGRLMKKVILTIELDELPQVEATYTLTPEEEHNDQEKV